MHFRESLTPSHRSHPVLQVPERSHHQQQSPGPKAQLEGAAC